jgi:hypothetical protein
MDLWVFAARHDFTELYDYCIHDSSVRSQVLELLSQPKGLLSLLEKQVSATVLSQMVARIIHKQMKCRHGRSYRMHCSTHVKNRGLVEDIDLRSDSDCWYLEY